VRLELLGIIGNNADKVESAGKIDTCCFDKTGTLTTLGFKTIKAYPEEELPMLNSIMGCCHHLIKLNGEIIGDPLEIEMLNFVGWQCNFG
jgi:cation-transporting ATPase 13A3/4/5